jgi:hypothetical protein
MHEIGALPLHGVVQHCDWGGYDRGSVAMFVAG